MADSGWIDDLLAAANAFDRERVAAFFTEDGIWESASTGHRWEGREEITRLWSVEAPGFSEDGHLTVTNKVGDETGWAIEWTFAGTHAESGKTFRSRGAPVGSLQDGKITAAVDYENPAYLVDRLVGPVQ